MEICLVCDLMLDIYGPVLPAMHLAKALAEVGHKVSIVSAKISENTKRLLKPYSGIEPIDLNARMFVSGGGSLSWFEAWSREAFLGLNSKMFDFNKKSIVINFSHTMATPSNIWYVQGPTSDSLRDMKHMLPNHYKIAYMLLRPALTYFDNRLIRCTASMSKLIIANSKFCASMFERKGLKVHDVIYPPIDCDLFKPAPAKPSGNYVLTYFGKETEFYTIKVLGDAGLKVKAFGSKAPYIPKKLLRHKNIEFLGKVSNDALVKLYSNALFTLFTFTHEPFGYVPVESMACGTPVLTYNYQGPSETVVNDVTGWLTESREDIALLAVKLWKNGYPSAMRRESRKRALCFNVEKTVGKWLETIGFAS